MSENDRNLEIKKQLLFLIIENNVNALEPEFFLKYLNLFQVVDNVRDPNGKRLLELAVDCGNYNAVKVLVERGAQVDIANDNGETPLGISRYLKERENGEEIYKLLNQHKKSLPIEVNPSNSSKEEEYEFDAINDTIEDVKRKLKVENGEHLKPKAIDYIEAYEIIHDFLKEDKFDVVDFLLDKTKQSLSLLDDDLKTLADISWERKQYKYLVNLLERDSEFPENFDESRIEDTENGAHDLRELVRLRKDLHVNIRSGNLRSVKEISKDLKCKMYLDTDNRSALAVSILKGQLGIYAYFLSIGADYKDHAEKSENFPNPQQRKQLMSLLEKHCVRAQSSHLQKVIRKYQVVGERSEEVTKQLNKMFIAMDKSTFLRPLLKVLEYVKYSIIFDVESEYVERVCLEYLEEERKSNHGIVFPRIKRCYIGAKNCCSSDPEKRKFIYSKLAHELCHLVASFLYENGALPYESQDKEREEKYLKIVKEIDVKKGDPNTSTDVAKFRKIREVFIKDRTLYEPSLKWRKEVIVRCPEILAYYGDDVGRALMVKYVSNVFNFYVEKFIPDCDIFAEDSFLFKPDSVLYEMSKYNGCLTKEEREVIPLKIPVNFEDKLFRINEETAESGKCNLMNLSLYILKTNNLTLCKLHVYQNLKNIHKSLVNRKCLFYGYNYFNENIEDFQLPLKWETYYDVIIVQEDDAMPGFDNLIESLEKVESTEKKRVIFIANENFECKYASMSDEIISFNWDSLSKELKYRLEKKKINFQGRQVMLCDIFGNSFDKKTLSPEFISRVMAGKAIGEDCSKLKILDEALFIERSLTRIPVDDFLEQMLNFEDIVFLTGIKEHEMIDKGFHNFSLKILSKDQCKYWELGSERILLPDQMEEAGRIFNSISEKINLEIGVHWIHYIENKFFYIQSIGSEKERLKFAEEVVQEDELLNLSLQSKARVVLITDEPGSGKSTLLEQLSVILKRKSPTTLVIRSTFNDIFSELQEDDDWKNIFTEGNSEKILDCFANRICKGDSAVKELFRAICTIPMRVSIFLDAIDELSNDYIIHAMKLLEKLKMNTESQIWVTSRTSYLEDLFIALKTVPYNLKLWDDEDQSKYLCKFWTYSLTKCNPSIATKKISEIVEETTQNEQSMDSATSTLIVGLRKLLELDAMRKISSFRMELENKIFHDFAEYQLKNTNFSGSFEFLGIPLHVFMIANVIFNSNFNLMICNDVFSLFSTFIEQKIDMFLKEKCRLSYEIEYVKRIIKKSKDSIEADHKTIARNSFGSRNSDSLHLLKLSNYDFLDPIGLGKMIGNQFAFIHKTFEEYFYSVSIYEDMRIGNPNGTVLKRILFNREFHQVKIFVNNALEIMMPETILESNFFADINLKECFKQVLKPLRFDDVFSHSNCLWKYIILQLESQENESMTEDFISLCMSVDIYSFIDYNAFRLLLNFQKEKWKMKMFDSSDDWLGNKILPSFEFCSRNELDLILKNIQFYDSVKSNCDHCKDLCNRETKLEERSENHSFECLRKQLVNELFEKKDSEGRNMLMNAFKNADKIVFEKTIDFAEGMFGDIYKELLKAKAEFGYGILYVTQLRKGWNLRNALEILEKRLTEKEMKDILMSKNNNGRPDLWSSLKSVENNVMNEFLDCFKEYIKDDDLYRSIFLMKDRKGDIILHLFLNKRNFNSVNVLIEEACKLFDVKSVCEKKKFIEWINSRDSDGYNIATWAALMLDKEMLKEFFKNLRKSLPDDKTLSIIFLESIVFCRDLAIDYREKYNNHAMMIFNYIFSLIRDDRSILNEVILEHKDEFGRNFISIASLGLDLGNIKTLIEKLRNHILSLNEMKKVFLQNDKKGNSILHYASANKDIGVFSLVCDVILELCNDDKEVLKSLLMKVNDDGENIITLNVNFCESEEVKKFIEELKRNQILNLNDIRKLTLQIDKKGNSVLHFASKNEDVSVFTLVCDEILELFKDDKEELKNLLMKVNNDGENIITLNVRWHESEEVKKLNEELKNKQILNLNEIKELLLQIDKKGNTILHNASENEDEIVFSLVCDEILELFNEDKLKSLKMKPNDHGMTLLYLINFYGGIDIISKLMECIGKELMTELLLRVDNEGNTCLHHWVKREIYAYALIEYIEKISECISKSDMEKVILTKNNCGRLFHQGNDDQGIIKKFLKTFLSEDSFQKLNAIEDSESLNEK